MDDIVYNMFKDFFCGSVAGVANCVSGYFLDTLKVRMQMNPNLEMWTTLSKVYVEGKFLRLFDGMLYPILTIPIINAISFGSYRTYKYYSGADELTAVNGMISGAFAGVMVSFVVTPVELIKCRMQLDGDAKYASSRACFLRTIAREGWGGLFKGFAATIARETMSWSMQFALYQTLKNRILGSEQKYLTTKEAGFVGGIAAFAAEICAYPIDVIKTHVQASESKLRIWGVGTQIYREYGMKGFATGIKPCLIRATLADGLGIVVYEKCHELIPADWHKDEKM